MSSDASADLTPDEHEAIQTAAWNGIGTGSSFDMAEVLAVARKIKAAALASAATSSSRTSAADMAWPCEMPAPLTCMTSNSVKRCEWCEHQAVTDRRFRPSEIDGEAALVADRVAALLPDECWVYRTSDLTCISLVGATFGNGAV